MSKIIGKTYKGLDLFKFIATILLLHKIKTDNNRVMKLKF